MNVSNIVETEADYTWQGEALDKIFAGSGVMSLDAGVGTGKTRIAFESFRHHIDLHRGGQTCDVFVAPSIRLTKQQYNDCKKFFDDCNKKLIGDHQKPLYTDIKCVEVNCETEDTSFSWNIPESGPMCNLGNHVIYFVCWASFKLDPVKELYWEKLFKNNEEYGRHNGYIFYDEAHIYDGNKDSRELIFGEDLMKRLNKALKEDEE
jgi:hypothetical protein|nr:MAG TPA_asm: ATP-dependent DNA helicase [Caudoviricetes sp.]